jgi:hypothetical protein
LKFLKTTTMYKVMHYEVFKFVRYLTNLKT